MNNEKNHCRIVSNPSNSVLPDYNPIEYLGADPLPNQTIGRGGFGGAGTYVPWCSIIKG